MRLYLFLLIQKEQSEYGRYFYHDFAHMQITSTRDMKAANRKQKEKEVIKTR